MSESLNETQQHALDFLRAKYKDHADLDPGFRFNDQLFLRYLRARNFNKDKAITMLEASIQWRKEFGVEKLDSWMDTVKREGATGKVYVRGVDKQGHAIMYMKPVKSDSKIHDDNLKHLVYNLERAVRTMDANNSNVEKILLLIDYRGK